MRSKGSRSSFEVKVQGQMSKLKTFEVKVHGQGSKGSGSKVRGQVSGSKLKTFQAKLRGQKGLMSRVEVKVGNFPGQSLRSKV